MLKFGLILFIAFLLPMNILLGQNKLNIPANLESANNFHRDLLEGFYFSYSDSLTDVTEIANRIVSSDQYKVRLDSIIGDSSALIYYYDNGNREISGLKKVKDPVYGNWINFNKHIYTYPDDLGSYIYEEYQWDIAGEKWRGLGKREEYFIAAEKSKQIVNFFWDDSEENWNNDNKSVINYDANDNITLSEYYNWDIINSRWDGNYRYTDSISSDGTSRSHQNFLWDKAKREWINSSKQSYVKDSDGNWIDHKGYRWDLKANDWIPTYFMEYSYNDAGKFILKTKYNCDSAMLEDNNQYCYSYDSEGRLQMELYQEWNFDAWETLDSTVYDYDVGGLKEIQSNYFLYTYDEMKLYNRVVREYNSSGLLIREEEKTGDGYPYTPAGSLLLEDYDEYGNWISVVRYRWKEEFQDWEGISKTERDYDSKNNRILNIRYEWDPVKFSFSPWEKLVLWYDHSISFEEVLLPYNYGGFNNKVEGKATYTWKDGDWTLDENFEYYYFVYNTATDPYDRKIFRMYPNPASEVLIIEHGSDNSLIAEIYTLDGKMILSKNLTGGQNFIDLSSLKQGMYIISLESDNYKQLERIIVK